MPVGSLNKRGLEDTTLVFDTWAHVGADELLIQWDCELSRDETEQLSTLAECLGYLGRSESWIEAELVTDESLLPIEFDASPHRDGFRPGPGWEQVSLMAAIPSEEYAAWRREATERILERMPLPEGKKKPPAKLLRERAKATEPYPNDLVDCLTKDTAWWKQHRWSQPPGSQRVIYWRRTDSLQVGTPPRPRRRPIHCVTTMVLAVTSPNGNRSALPPRARTLPQAEIFHRAIISRVAKGERIDCPELTGRDQHGAPLSLGHQHAHVLPLDLDGDGRLDHIIVYAPMGLGPDAQHAIRTLNRTWTKGGADAFQLALAGEGSLDTLRSLPPPLRERIERILGPRQGAHVWTSITPFVPPRFLKRRGENTLHGQINAELHSRGLPLAETVEELDLSDQTLALRHFVRRRRQGGAQPPVDVGYALRLQFANAVSGPITLGYASHFGLGIFAAT